MIDLTVSHPARFPLARSAIATGRQRCAGAQGKATAVGFARAAIGLVAVVIGISAAAQQNDAPPVASAASAQDDSPPQHDRPSATGGRLDLLDGGFVTGQLRPSTQAQTIRWQADGFTQPFDFALQSVWHIAMDTADAEPPPADEFACVLRNGACIYGRLDELTATDVVLQSMAGQRLRIDRQQVERLIRATPEVRSGRRTSIHDPGRSTPWEFDSSGNRWKLAAQEPPKQQRAAAPAADPFGAPPADDNPPAGADDPPADERNARRQAELRARRLALQRLQRPGALPATSSGYFVDLQMPTQCLLELDVTWEKIPQFNLSLGIDHTHRALKQAIRLTLWDGELVITRELDQLASLVPVLSIKDLTPQRRLQLMIYLDRSTGRAVIRTRSGELLAEFATPSDTPAEGSGVRLLTAEGTQVAQLAASSFSWDSLADAESVGGASRVTLSTGRTIAGAIRRLDAANGMLAVGEDAAAEMISLAEVQQLTFAAPDQPPMESEAADPSEPVDPAEVADPPEPAGPAEPADPQPSPPLHQVTTVDGWYFQGQWLGLQEDHLRMKVSGIDDPVQVPLRRLESISSTQTAVASATRPSRTGQLITDSMALFGKLVDSDPDSPQLLWHPDGSPQAAPLVAPVDGEIVYHTARPAVEVLAKTSRAAPPRRVGGLGGALLQIFGGPVQPQPARRVIGADGQVMIIRPPATAPSSADSQATLFLRTGDTVPCEVTRIDDTGIHFSSSAVEHGLARHDQVKSVILAGLLQPKQISVATRERLLMVPRMRRDDPPTHLVCSRSGDFLRGRLLGLDDESLRIEVRLETRVIPRDRIAQIFWMHPESEAKADSPAVAAAADSPPQPDSGAAAKTPDAPPPLRVQALRRDGTRITFDYHACRDGSTLVGHNEIVGTCQVDLAHVNRLLLGDAIERSLDDSPLALWRLHDAPIPKAFLPGAEDGQGGAGGTESALVGKPAPEFELELLSGEKFRLAEQRGRVVVLDFWASWCGPCIQAMPQIEAVVGEFPETDVQLVAINLQEQSPAVTAALERMGLDVTVALDRNGSVADQYGVTAIPQSVIVDRDGNVARLYVGINASLANEMRAAITELLQPPEAAEDGEQ